MRLGLILFGRIKHNNIPHRFRGKYRIVKEPSMHDLLKMKIDFEREERNMLILRHPYLTAEQSSGHKKALSGTKPTFMDRKLEEKRQEFSKQITFTEHLSHLAYGEDWDV